MGKSIVLKKYKNYRGYILLFILVFIAFSVSSKDNEKKNDKKSQMPEVSDYPGAPTLDGHAFTVLNDDQIIEEFIAKGTATSYKAVGELGFDGKWNIEPDSLASYKTRFIVIRPSNPKKFNGVVLVEWLNVTGGFDFSPMRNYTQRELVREGYIWVGVSSQKVGIDGGSTIMGGQGSMSLKEQNPERYGKLYHPGDEFAYDIFSQVGQFLKSTKASKMVFGKLKPKHFIASGESQSGFFMAGYVNLAAPRDKVYDGYFVYSHFSMVSAVLDNNIDNLMNASITAQIRNDLDVPVFIFETETDILGVNSMIAGYHKARQPNTHLIRVWEIPGAAHADKYLYGGNSVDDGNASYAELASAWEASTDMNGMKLKKPFNNAPQHHYVVQAALNSVKDWVVEEIPPAKGEPIEIVGAGTMEDPVRLVLDENGNAKGGVRSPWMDVPTGILSGIGTERATMLAGHSEPFDKEKLDSIYPGGREEYLKSLKRHLINKSMQDFYLLLTEKRYLRLLNSHIKVLNKPIK